MEARKDVELGSSPFARRVGDDEVKGLLQAVGKLFVYLAQDGKAIGVEGFDDRR